MWSSFGKKTRNSFLTLKMERKLSTKSSHPPPQALGELAPTHPPKHHAFLVVLKLRREGLFFSTLNNLSFFDHATSQDTTRLSVHSLGLALCSSSQRIKASIELNQQQRWWSLNPSTISNKNPWMENMNFFLIFFLIHSYIHRWSIFNPPNLNVLC
jgi:hypothetical protein